MAEHFHSAEIVKDAAGRQYHIGLAPGEVAPNILLVGDPQRAERVAGLFERVSLRKSEREFVTITGVHQGLPLSVMGTGIGCDNVEIATIELCQLVERPLFIRAGSSGSLQAGVDIGDLAISSGAVRLENTSTAFVPEGYPALAHHEVVLALLAAARETGARHSLGLTACASGFYGAQGRRVPGFPPRDPELPARLGELGVVNMEMETSTLFTLAQLRGLRAGAVCAIYASRQHNRFIDPVEKHAAEGRCLDVALRAFHLLADMDRARGARPHWVPADGVKAR